MKNVKTFSIMLLLVVMAGLKTGCASPNNRLLSDEKVTATTDNTGLATVDGEGNVQISSPGVGGTASLLDTEGIYMATPGTGMQASITNEALGVCQVYSPKNFKCQKLTYSPQPKEGEPQLIIEGLEANMSDVIAQYVAALAISYPNLTTMSQAERDALVKQWESAGGMFSELADIAKALFPLLFPTS